MNKLKQHWGIESNWQIAIIFVVFAITGSTASYIGKPILSYLNITPDNLGGFGYWTIRILLLFVVYQFLLVGFGWLFGQYKFFWEFEKKMLKRLGLKRLIGD
ncbi:DUF6787 family protein [Seonamhaeicola aphaedonensis]|uniref:DUF6787 domain-containing protein n=1 Tax=Seonamhaeicola aphaedonensis TaxID=1461338 RepID=A0A3D9H8P4_9FLAO|nr:DUF6787 family protein [Seonamhaeicola aphaedonensis]RED45863.1 hypothetical protein DFQ02_1078 [Seonamhaeicola aphaedonensis]